MKYDAFISYRHTELDMEIAKKVHSTLESFKVPVPVQKKTGKKKIRRVFRDQEELPIGSDLDDNITAALCESEYLIVICSPRTMGSEWVMKEIDTFISMHDRKHILSILIEGEPWESFPPQLLVDDYGRPVEPLAADVRGENAKERNSKFKTEIMRLAAPILGCTYDDLKQRHRERMIRKTFGTVAAIAGAVAIAGAGFGVYSWMTAQKMSELANEKSMLAEQKEQYAAELENANAELELGLDKQRELQSGYLAVTAMNLFESGDREDAALVAIEALPMYEGERPYVAEAEYALSQITYAYDGGDAWGYDRLLKHELKLVEMVINSSGSYIATVDQAYAISIWSTEDWMRCARIEGTLSEYGVVKYPKSIDITDDALFVVFEDKLIKYDIYGNVIYEAPMNRSIYKAEVFADDGFAICAGTNVFDVVDLADGSIVRTVENSSGNSFANFIEYDSGYLAIVHYEDGIEATTVSIYDVNNDYSEVTVSVHGGTPNRLKVDEGSLYVLTTYEEHLKYKGNLEFYLTAIDCSDGRIVWTDTFTNVISNYSYYDSFIETKRCKGIDGVDKPLCVAIDSGFRAYNAETGDKISQTSLSASCVMLRITNTGGAYVGQDDGDIDIIAIASGKHYSENTIHTNIASNRMMVSNQKLYSMSYDRKDIAVLSYHDAPDLELIAENTDTTSDMLSFYEDYFVATDYNGMGRIFTFYDINGDMLEKVTIDEDVLYYSYGFTGDDYFALAGTDKFMHWYDPKNKTEYEYPILPDGVIDSFVLEGLFFTNNRKYAVAMGMYNISVFDMCNRKRIYYNRFDSSIGGAAISEDGKTVYLAFLSDDFCTIDIASGDITEYEDLDIHVTSSSNRNVVVSDDGMYVAVSCNDGYMRTVELETGGVTGVYQVYSQNKCYLEFIPGTSLVLVNTENEYVDVFDAYWGDKFASIPVAFSNIKNVTYDFDAQVISVVDISGVTLLTMNGYKPLAHIERGFGYISADKKFILKNYEGYCTTRYKDYETLITEAQNQFPLAELTDEEREMYNIEYLY